MVTLQGQDARPYAMVTAAAVLATWQVLRAAGDPRPRWFAAYGLSLVLLGYLDLFGLLLVPAHAITLTALCRHGAFPRRGHSGPGHAPRSRFALWWLVTTAAVGAAVAPVVVWGWFQREQIGWIRRPGWFDFGYLVSWLAAGSVASAVVVGVLAVVGARRGDSPGPPEQPGPVGSPRPTQARALTWPVLIRRERGVRRIWVVETGRGWQDPAPLLAPGFRPVGVWRPDHSPVTLGLYQRLPGAAVCLW